VGAPSSLYAEKEKGLRYHPPGQAIAEEVFRQEHEEFDFGNLNQLTLFRDPHPAVMQERIRQFNWADSVGA